MGKKTQVSVVVGLMVLGILTYLFNPISGQSRVSVVDPAYASEFNYLRSNGNSSCSGAFLNSILSMPDDKMLQGSCCSPMNLDKYIEQRNNLKKYKDVSQIPADPYNISAKLAKELLGYEKNITLTADEQSAITNALPNTKEKGFCCCKCWRWFVYEGLSKFLVHSKHFTSQQIVEVLNNSDGCGGAN